MKVISFSKIEFVKKILDLSKIHTCRPAWKIEDEKQTEAPKPPRFKIGEKVQLHFKSRSPYKWFCSNCGVGYVLNRTTYYFTANCSCHVFNQLNEDGSKTELGTPRFKAKSLVEGQFANEILIKKHIAISEITEVVEIEIKKHFNGIRDHFIIRHVGLRKEFGDDTDFAKRFATTDGFDSTADFFSFFNDHYDLSSPKSFYVYTFKVIQ